MHVGGKVECGAVPNAANLPSFVSLAAVQLQPYLTLSYVISDMSYGTPCGYAVLSLDDH